MSWYRRVKFLYTVFSQLLFFVAWCTFGKIYFNIEIVQSVFLISLLAILIMEYIIYITNRKNFGKRMKLFLSIIITTVICSFLIWVVNNSYFVFYSIFIILSIILSYKFQDESVDYYTYKDRVVKGLLLFLLLAIVISLIDKQSTLTLLKNYIFIIIISVLLLRESRRYTFKIKSKKNYLFNLIISAAILIVSIDNIYLLFKKMVILILNGISYVLQIILDIIIKVLGKPIMYIVNFIYNRLNRSLDEVLEDIKGSALSSNNNDVLEGNIDQVNSTLLDSVVFINIMKILLLILIFFIIYKIVIGRRNFNINKNENIIEEKEKIKRNPVSRNFIGNMIKKILKTKKGIKVQIRDVYRQFEKKTDEKKILKPYMTATQLNNVTKLYVDNVDDLDAMSIIYNEAKFSQHEMNESDLKAIKDNYENVKKQL